MPSVQPPVAIPAAKPSRPKGMAKVNPVPAWHSGLPCNTPGALAYLGMVVLYLLSSSIRWLRAARASAS